ncbi:hypothetical protein KIN_02550 [Litoreibacter roseus]|uniref:Glycolipid-binding protein n=2 Tax=Litoreibacter roseus TaxID=2601869 RepID=A0A6N6JAC8_9RHOB|nr:hypothetical protein KIN_02550 [Litoreibacter roseus]
MMNELPRYVLWRRIDVDGMDACSVSQSDEGYVTSGVAVYLAENGPARVSYEVTCDSEWRSRSVRVSGWIGRSRISLTLSRSSGTGWSVNGERLHGVDDLQDIDLGFTPATNTNALKRLRLANGTATETTALWLDVKDWRFKPLRQVYRRVSDTVYEYSSPSHDYHTELTVDGFGIVRSYPELWEAISHPAPRLDGASEVRFT